MNMDELEYGIAKYGTPLYLFDIDIMKKNVSIWREKLGEEACLCFAMKANPFLTSQMASITDRIEVCSMGEFRICKELQIDPGKILISGVLKEKEDLYEIMDYYHGKCVYTIESLSQYYCMADWCNTNDEVIHVYLRLTSGNQFGMDEKIIEDILYLRNMCPLMKIIGIHYFSGTQKKSVEKIEKELKYLDAFCLGLEQRTGYRIKELEYGPGISVAYFEGQDDKTEENISAIRHALSVMKWRGKVTLEMGRALAAPCGYYLTRVRDIKQNNRINYCIVDGGIHQIHYDGQIRGIYHPILQKYPEHGKGLEREWTICGSLCTVNDVLVQKIKLKNLKIGDVLIFERAGAYAMTEGMALFLSHELPQIVFYSKRMGWKLVRKEKATYTWNMERMI